MILLSSAEKKRVAAEVCVSVGEDTTMHQTVRFGHFSRPLTKVVGGTNRTMTFCRVNGRLVGKLRSLFSRL